MAPLEEINHDTWQTHEVASYLIDMLRVSDKGQSARPLMTLLDTYRNHQVRMQVCAVPSSGPSRVVSLLLVGVIDPTEAMLSA